MKLTFDRRYDKWEELRKSRMRCERCMNDAPHEWCCKHQCGSWKECKKCTVQSHEGNKLCEVI